MKTSNKLIIGLVSFISLYILAAFTEIAVRIKPNGELGRVPHITELADFKYLKVNNLQVEIDFLEKSLYDVKVFDGDDIPKLEYQMSGDTLVIDQFIDPKRSKLRIGTNRNSFKGITAIFSDIKLNGAIDSLEVDQRDSEIKWFSSNKDFKVQSLHITSDMGFVFIHDVIIEELELDASGGLHRVDGYVKSLKGKAFGAALYMKEVGKVNLAKDSLNDMFINDDYR